MKALAHFEIFSIFEIISKISLKFNKKMKLFQKINKKMNKKEIAETLEIELRTLYNWEKTRPKLYQFIMKAFEKENIENENNAEIIEIFSKLSEKEKEFYITDMKARILKKELE